MQGNYVRAFVKHTTNLITALAFLAAFVLLLVAGEHYAFASTGSALGQIAGDVVEMLIYAAGLVIVGLVARLIHVLAAKYKIDIPDPWMERLREKMTLGVAYAEEQGRKFAAKKVDAIKAPDKLEVAAKFVLGVEDDRKLVKKGEEWLKRQLEAHLNLTREESAQPLDAVAGITSTEEK